MGIYKPTQTTVVVDGNDSNKKAAVNNSGELFTNDEDVQELLFDIRQSLRSIQTILELIVSN